MTTRPRPAPRRPLRVPPSRRREASPAPSRRRPAVAGGWLGRWLDRQPDAGRFILALVLILLGVAVAGGAARADVVLHRGVETGAEVPYVRHVTGRDLATNVDLSRYRPGQLDAVATALRENGFRYVRQSFAWAEIEPAPGDFRWERYDAIVDALDRHQIQPLAVLHRSPAWARRPEQATAADAPPVDFRTYETFVSAVVARYGERVPFVQLWDLPNRPERWGGAPPDPAAYVTLLGHGSNGARSARAGTAVVLAELDPAPAADAASGDLAFLRAIYRNRGAPFFDVVAARIDGGARSPFDRRVDGAPSLSRATRFRRLMVEAGDAAKPVWATHFGWEAGAGPGTVGAGEQAAFTVAGIERARAEWPWMGPLFAWGLAPGDGGDGEGGPGRALLRADGSPTPLLTALADLAASGAVDVAPTGFLPVDAAQFRYEGNWASQHLGLDTYRTTSEVGARATVRFAGTGVDALVRLGPQAGDVEATLDGEPLPVALDSFQAQDVAVPLAGELSDRPHELVLALAGPGELTIGGLVVERAVPLRWPVVLLVGCGLGLLFLGLREAAYLVAERTGRLQRRRGADLWPELPPLPDWRPARRA